MVPETSFCDLVQRVRCGDGLAAEELVRAYEPEVRRAIRVRLTDARLRRLVDSVDICQSVLAGFFVRRLRPGPAAGQREQPDDHRAGARHAELHGPRAGPRRRRRRRACARRVFTGRDSVRVAHRPPAVPRTDAELQRQLAESEKIRAVAARKESETNFRSAQLGDLFVEAFDPLLEQFDELLDVAAQGGIAGGFEGVFSWARSSTTWRRRVSRA